MTDIQKKRESYFGALLRKIDVLVQETVDSPDFLSDPIYFAEVEGEFAFMAQEVDQLESLLPNLNWSDETEIDFIETRLIGLKEHIEQFCLLNLPDRLAVKLDSILEKMQSIESNLPPREGG